MGNILSGDGGSNSLGSAAAIPFAEVSNISGVLWAEALPGGADACGCASVQGVCYGFSCRLPEPVCVLNLTDGSQVYSQRGYYTCQRLCDIDKSELQV